MIVKEEFLSKLRRYFNLNLYEVKIWTALLSRGVATAGELSDIANVPRSRSYDILESLEKKGFAITKLGKPIKYIAVPPEEVIERVKKRVKEDTDSQVGILNKLKSSEILSELKLLHSQGIELVEPTEFTGCLKGRSNFYNHIEMLLKGAQRSICIMTTEEGLLRKIDNFKSVLQKAKDKGVKIKIAAPFGKANSRLLKDLRAFAEVKHTDKVKSRFIVIDGKELIFALLDDADVHPTYDTGIWVKTPFFVSAVQEMFEALWANMKSAESVVKQ